jgi:hypothetical protein
VIESYLTDTIDIITELKDANGVVTATTVQSDVKARWEDKNRIIVNQAGKEETSEGFLLVDPAASVSYTSKFKMKKIGGQAIQDPAKLRQPISIGRAHGFAGYEFWRVWL